MFYVYILHLNNYNLLDENNNNKINNEDIILLNNKDNLNFMESI